MLGAEIALAVVVGIAVVCAVVFSRRAALRKQVTDTAATPAPVRRGSSGEVQVTRPSKSSVEGLEIRYGSDALVRAVRVGAMNSEHKELLLTMDEVQWHALPNSQKQEVLAAARSTWAQKMCGDGPDIAYVVLKTERGEIIGRADPHSVTVL